MSKCDLRIEWDRPDRTYTGGVQISGVVHVYADQDVQCNGLYLDTYWQTHGEGNCQLGGEQSQLLFEGRLVAGQTYEHPFSFPAPHGPPTYRGRYLNIDHYVKARVDVPWAIDPRIEEEFILLPGNEAYGNLPIIAKPGEAADLSKYALPAAVVCFILGFACLFPFGFILIPLGTYLLWLAFRKTLAEKKTGQVDLQWGTLRVIPGDSVPMQLTFTPLSTLSLNGITAKLTASERCVYGSGTNKRTYTHKVHEDMLQLAPAGQIPVGKRMKLGGRMTIPAETIAYSFSTTDNDLIWQIELRIDIPSWPDWVDTKVITVRPDAEAVTIDPEEIQPTPVVESSAPSPERYSPFPEPVESFEQDERSEEPSPLTPIPPAVPVDEPEEQVVNEPHETPLVNTPRLGELLDRVASVGRYSREREDLIEKHVGETFDCTIEIAQIDRTYGLVSDERFRDGRTVIGTLAGTEHKVALKTVASQNDAIDALSIGERHSTRCIPEKWDVVYDRLALYDASID